MQDQWREAYLLTLKITFISRHRSLQAEEEQVGSKCHWKTSDRHEAAIIRSSEFPSSKA